MHLIFLHGAPGVGKRTIAMALSQELQFPFLNFQHLSALLGPVFGYSSANFNALRDGAYKTILENAMSLPDDGLIASFTYEPSIPLGNFAKFIKAAQDSGGIGLFIGLTCDTGDLKARVESPERSSLGKISDFEAVEESMSAGVFELPELPGPSISIDTTGETPDETVQNILAMLPDDLKHSMTF
ncbi:MAG TPA: AAA family ATPase [Pseudomonadales bacterium]|nr:AAA family ATPase [Pseudomonadales bacterium]